MEIVPAVMRLLRIQIANVQVANGFSPEALDFAVLLGRRQSSYDARVFLQDWQQDSTRSGDLFIETAHVPTVRMDTGWRPNYAGTRSAAARVWSLLRFRRMLPLMMREARRYDPDVVSSSQQRWDCAAATYIARRLHRPHVIDLHFTVGSALQPPFALRPLLGDPLQRLRACALVLAVSDFIREEAIRHGVAPERVATLYNTREPIAYPADSRLSVRAELGLSCAARLVTMVARMAPEKGQTDAIQAFATIATAFPECHLLLVGDGARRPRLEQMVSGLGLAQRVRFTGFRADVPRLLAASDLFIHPSRNEPFGVALLEAQTAGLPVLAYREGGTREVVESGTTGMLAPPGDVAALARNLGALLADPRRAAAMGCAARERVARLFRPERAAADFARHLERVVAQKTVA